ncbi:MAG: CBS domain-containing protein [Leptolyngbya sp. SIO1D8]|nr:CBS domain-containing protein [Leptolyngbya sp. SIO1D8]
MLTVREIMTRPVVVIHSLATVENAIWLMRAKRVRSLIVEKLHEDDAYGILTEKDVVYKVISPGKNPAFVRVGSIMRQPCIHLPANATVQEAAQIFADTGIHRAPVIEHNELLGIVSITDILVKGYPVPPAQDELTQRINEALQHARIIDDEDAQMQQECEIAWQVFEDMHLGFPSTI